MKAGKSNIEIGSKAKILSGELAGHTGTVTNPFGLHPEKREIGLYIDTDSLSLPRISQCNADVNDIEILK